MRSHRTPGRARWLMTAWALAISLAVASGCTDRDRPRAAKPAGQSPPTRPADPSGAGTRTTADEGDAGTGVKALLATCAIDTHTHIDGVVAGRGSVSYDFESAAARTVERLDQEGVRRAIVFPPPQSSDPQQQGKYTEDVLADAVARYPDRLVLGGGGGTLAPILDRNAGGDGSADRAEFVSEARKLDALGVAVFGELTALHLSFNPNHPFIEIPPDHPLLLALADRAAASKVPIDLHMEAVASDRALPAGFSSPPNPGTLHANIAALERLLDHNRAARIVWAHIGWDNTGDMTLARLERLLSRHPNLYLQLRAEEGHANANSPVDESGRLRPEWREFISKHADRIVAGGDEFMGGSGRQKGRPGFAHTWDMVRQLDQDTARKVACTTPAAVYRLG